MPPRTKFPCGSRSGGAEVQEVSAKDAEQDDSREKSAKPHEISP